VAATIGRFALRCGSDQDLRVARVSKIEARHCNTKRDLELIRERLKWAERLHATKPRRAEHEDARKSSGNVFTDLGLPNSNKLLKASSQCRSNKLNEQTSRRRRPPSFSAFHPSSDFALMRCRPVSVGRL
jgi:hypothetical protein